MDIGRAVIGGSSVGALVLAGCLGAVVAQRSPITTDVQGGGICATFPDGGPTPETWFLTSFRNDTNHGVRVRDVRARDLHRVTLSHLAIAPHPREQSPGLVAGQGPGRPAEYGRTVPVDSGYVIPAHGELDVVGQIALRDGADVGRLHGLVVTSDGVLGTVQTVVDDGSFGIGIGEGHAQRDIGCADA